MVFCAQKCIVELRTSKATWGWPMGYILPIESSGKVKNGQKVKHRFKRVASRASNRNSGILCDQDIILTGLNSSKKYPTHLRRIKFYNSEYDRTFVFLTNNFKIKAQTVTQLYKHRWGIELFFKWIKQNLKVKSF